MGSASFFYFSVVPQDIETEPGTVYNYDKVQYEKLKQLGLNESVDLSEGQMPEWFTYTRDGNDVFNGNEVVVYHNSKPWEFPEGTKEYRYLFDVNGKIVIAGAYINSSSNYFTQSLLIKILNTLVIN